MIAALNGVIFLVKRAAVEWEAAVATAVLENGDISCLGSEIDQILVKDHAVLELPFHMRCPV